MKVPSKLLGTGAFFLLNSPWCLNKDNICKTNKKESHIFFVEIPSLPACTNPGQDLKKSAIQPLEEHNPPLRITLKTLDPKKIVLKLPEN